MKKYVFTLTFLLLSLSTLSTSAAENIVTVTGIDPVDLAATINSKSVNLLQTETVLFSNDNTFVRFQSSVNGLQVTILVPNTMSSNNVVEALMKIRTAYSNGARIVSVAPVNPSLPIVIEDAGKSIDLDFLRLATIAGADYAFVGDERVKLTKPRLAPRNLRTGGAAVVGGSHPELGKKISATLGVPYYDSAAKFADDHNRDGIRQVIYVSSAAEKVNQNILTTMADLQTLKKLRVSVNLVAPNLPYARSDKNDQPGITVGGKLIADLFDHSGADSLTFVRAHAPQSQGFFHLPTFQVFGRETINKYLAANGVQVIVAPDAGALKDDSLYAKDLNLNIGVINKLRDPITTKIKMAGYSSTEPVTGRVVAIIDDETASGSTLAQAAEYLKKMGAAKIIAVVTHLTGSAKAAIDSEFISEIVVTDTLPINEAHPKVKVLSVTNEVAKSLVSLVGRQTKCEVALIK